MTTKQDALRIINDYHAACNAMKALLQDIAQKIDNGQRGVHVLTAAEPPQNNVTQLAERMTA